MKNKLKLAITLCYTISSIAGAKAITFGGKIGVNNAKGKLASNDNGILFGNKAGDNTYSGKRNNSFAVDAFAQKSLFNTNTVFIDGELAISMNNRKTVIDANAGNIMLHNILNQVTVKEKLGLSAGLNIGFHINKGTSAYAKLGTKISMFSIEQKYNPDPTKSPTTKSNNKINPNLILGVGLSKNLSDHLIIMAEGTYNISKLGLNDFNAEVDSGPATILNANFKNRKVNMNCAGIKIGAGIAL